MEVKGICVDYVMEMGHITNDQLNQTEDIAITTRRRIDTESSEEKIG